MRRNPANGTASHPQSGDFRPVHAAFAASLAATMMVRIQRGGVRADTGLDAAHAYRELASILTSGISI